MKTNLETTANVQVRKPNEKVAAFRTYEEAWAFMKECDAAGTLAGYPSLHGPYLVRYLPAEVR